MVTMNKIHLNNFFFFYPMLRREKKIEENGMKKMRRKKIRIKEYFSVLLDKVENERKKVRKKIIFIYLFVQKSERKEN